MKRRIVQRIENQRWAYYVQRRRWGFWRDAAGPFTTRAAAMETVITMRARDDYGGHMPWETKSDKAMTQRHFPPAPYPCPPPPRRGLIELKS